MGKAAEETMFPVVGHCFRVFERDRVHWSLLLCAELVSMSIETDLFSCSITIFEIKISLNQALRVLTEKVLIRIVKREISNLSLMTTIFSFIDDYHNPNLQFLPGTQFGTTSIL